MIRFCLNGLWQTLDNVEPSMTVLRYLRTVAGQVATKEGCASGDCGACTVIVASANDCGQWQLEAVNSCIALLASVHDKHLITVEGLADAAGGQTLHPVQQALVDFHGSQCGFCTPGFVMSLVAVYENNNGEALSEAQILDALSGNLCRCTGYRPIIDAGLQSHCYPANEALFYQADAVPPNDPCANTGTTASLTNQTDSCHYPTTEAELQRLMLAYPKARLVAGGTDLLLEQTQQFKSLPHLIGLGQVEELRSLQTDGGQVTVGAAVTLTQLEHYLSDSCPAFTELLHRVGSRQIRNSGTLAGNIANASPIGDTPPMLLALDASLRLVSRRGDRQVPINEFYHDYKQTELASGEYIRSVQFQLPTVDCFLQAYKVSKRFEDDISAMLLVVRWQVVDGRFRQVRIACGGMAAIPKRALQVEATLEGATAGRATIEAAMLCFTQDFSPLSDVRASADYRLQVAANSLLKAWLQFAEPEQNVGAWSARPPRKAQQIWRQS